MGGTTIPISTEKRDELRKFRNACGEEYTYAEAIGELLAIAAREDYWDGEDSLRFASVSRVNRIEQRQEKLYKLVQSMKDDKQVKEA